MAPHTIWFGYKRPAMTPRKGSAYTADDAIPTIWGWIAKANRIPKMIRARSLSSFGKDASGVLRKGPGQWKPSRNEVKGFGTVWFGAGSRLKTREYDITTCDTVWGRFAVHNFHHGVEGLLPEPLCTPDPAPRASRPGEDETDDLLDHVLAHLEDYDR